MATIASLLLLLVVVVVLLGVLAAGTFGALMVGIAIGERLHRRRADRAGFGPWLDGDRRLDDDGLLALLTTRPTAEVACRLDGRPVVDTIEALEGDHPVAALDLPADVRFAEARLRVWARDPGEEHGAPPLADVVVVGIAGHDPVTAEPIGTDGWLDLAQSTRHLPWIHVDADAPGLVVTDETTVHEIGARRIHEARPSWPDPPDDTRLTIPLSDGRGVWVHAAGRGDTFLLRNAGDETVGFGVTFGERCRPDWPRRGAGRDQNSST